MFSSTSATPAKLSKRKTSRNTSPRSSTTMIPSRLHSSTNWPRNCYCADIDLKFIPVFKNNIVTGYSNPIEPVRGTRRDRFPTFAGSKRPEAAAEIQTVKVHASTVL
jgi:hypothetical protein